MEQRAIEFLGVGWSFPITLEGGAVQPAHYEQAVQASIWMILGTAPGERVMRPDFGCGIHDLVFDTNSAATAGLIASQVREALLRWEPRIEVHNVAAVPDPAQPARLLIEIAYQVRATNSRFNLVYPFYLE